MKIGTDFSGIGAPEMALKYLGIDFKSVFACEIDKYARQSFEQLHEPKTFYNDITTRNHKEVEQLDLYVAGFPCQSFSMAGKRKGFEETRGTLFFNVAEFIKENQPKTFILENVKGLLSHDKGRTFQTIVDILSNGGGTQNGQISLDMFEDGLGYHIYWKVLNTKNYGIPQNRERIFIVGFKDFRDFNFPKEMPLELKLGDMLQDNPNGKYYLSDKGIENLNKNQKFNKFDPLNIDSQSAACITARCNKISNDNNFIEVEDKYYLTDNSISRISNSRNKTKFKNKDSKYSGCLIAEYGKIPSDGTYIEVDDKYYLSDKLIESFTKHKERHTEKGTGFKWEVKQKDDVANCLRANASLCPTDNTIEVDDKYYLSEKVVKRIEDNLKEKDKENNTNEIRTHYLGGRKGDNKKGGTGHLCKTDGTSYCLDTANSQAIEVSKEVRTDEAKKKRKETGTNDFRDKKIEWRKQDYSNTLTTSLTNDHFIKQNKIRRLTPLECWRLQGFKDEDFFSVKDVSDTQLYKQAGNSITVNVLMEIFKKIYVNNK